MESLRCYSSEELKEVSAAALLLTSLKYAALDVEAASELQTLKTQFLRHASEQPKTKIPRRRPSQPLPAIEDLPIPLESDLLPLLQCRPPPIPPVPSLNGLIGDCSTPFVKQVTHSDVRADQNRLAMNKPKVEGYILPLLTQEEQRRLVTGLEVTVYDLQGKSYDMMFKIWGERSNVLIGGWKTFFQDHGLIALSDFVYVWLFRHRATGEPCFIIASRRFLLSRPIKPTELAAIEDMWKK